MQQFTELNKDDNIHKSNNQNKVYLLKCWVFFHGAKLLRGLFFSHIFRIVVCNRLVKCAY